MLMSAAMQRNYLFQLSSRALRRLGRNPQLRKRVFHQIADLHKRPERFESRVKPYVATDGYAWRDGDYRYCCRVYRTEEKVEVEILAIIHRSEAKADRLQRIFQ